MKFAVGYQLPEPDEAPFAGLIEDYRDDLTEVYFPWADMPSGRAAMATRRGYTDWTAQSRLEEDLRAIRQTGLKLDLLFNAACYGPDAVSENLAHRVVSVLDHLGGVVGGVDVVTTTSPFVAHVVGKSHPHVEVRASVNMRIGTIQGMEQLAELFDSFYVQREYNRDPQRLAALKAWADENDKGLLMLANSGCFAHCSSQSFHDNMVAHDAQIDRQRNLKGFVPMACWRLLKDRRNWPMILQGSWVRPEDLHHYEGLFETVKLATRMHQRPRLVLDAYVRGSYRGNLLDLFEPGFGPALAPFVIDAARLPEDWFARTRSCGRSCVDCSYCAEILESALVCAS
jgi:collagenase-like PrtC family protease